jgi:hypothetical protein
MKRLPRLRLSAVVRRFRAWMRRQGNPPVRYVLAFPPGVSAVRRQRALRWAARRIAAGDSVEVWP